MTRRTAIVIGSGIGGIACAIRLQSLGFDTHIVEQLDDVGGRAYVRRAQGFTFDMGPTVLTVPHFIEELFSLYTDIVTTGLTSSGTSRIYSVVIGAAEAADVINAAMKA